MYRNLFAVFATLSLGVGATSAATPTDQTSSQSLEQRVMAAQESIGTALNATQEPTAKAGSQKLAQYGGYGGYHRYYSPPWHNFSNFCNYYYSSC